MAAPRRQTPQYIFVSHDEDTNDPQVISAREAILKNLKVNDDVMVRDVLNNCRDDWYHGRVIGIVETKNEAEAVWVVYKRKKNGEKYYVQSAKVNGIIMPLDEDVWTIMTVGQMALSVMKDIRTGTC